MEEIWKDIPGHEGLYQASTSGYIRSLQNSNLSMNDSDNRILSGRPARHGYLRVALHDKNKIRKNHSVHRLIGYTFLPLENYKGMEINHKNGVKDDNRLENIEWTTRKGNIRHAVENGLWCYGEKKHNAKLKEKDIPTIRNKFKTMKVSDIAKEYHVDHNTVASIIKGETWSHVPYPDKEENLKSFGVGIHSRKGIHGSNTKLTEREVREIKRLKGKRPQRIVARFYNTSQSTVNAIQNNRLWVYI